jgi:hypothetical protein
MTTECLYETRCPVVDFGRLEREVDDVRSEFRSTNPCWHIGRDNRLSLDAAQPAIQEFPPPGPLHDNERNLDRSDPTTGERTRRRNHEARNLPHVVRFADQVIGIDKLLGDDQTASRILAIQDRLPAKRTG